MRYVFATAALLIAFSTQFVSAAQNRWAAETSSYTDKVGNVVRGDSEVLTAGPEVFLSSAVSRTSSTSIGLTCSNTEYRMDLSTFSGEAFLPGMPVKFTGDEPADAITLKIGTVFDGAIATVEPVDLKRNLDDLLDLFAGANHSVSLEIGGRMFLSIPATGSTAAVKKFRSLCAPLLDPVAWALDFRRDCMETYNTPMESLDVDEATKLCKRAIADNPSDPDVKLALSRVYYKQDRKAEVVELYTQAAELGSVQAEYLLGWAYYRGDGVEEDETKAAGWFVKSAEHGHMSGQYRAGFFSELGIGMPKNYANAAKWYEQASQKGSLAAFTDLGMLYRFGSGVEQDHKKAADLVRTAAEGGYARAQRYLGDFYANGIGVTEDADEAVEWYKKAAVQGDEEAIEKLSELRSK